MGDGWELTVRGLVSHAVEEALDGHVVNLKYSAGFVTDKVTNAIASHLRQHYTKEGFSPALILDGDDPIFASVRHKLR